MTEKRTHFSAGSDGCLSAEDREALDQVYISHLKKEIERLRDVAQPVPHPDLLASTVSCSGTEITIQCNNHGVKDRLMDFLTGDASQPSPAATVEPKDRPFFECPGCGKDIAETDQPHAEDCPRAHSSADSASPQLTDSRIFAESEARFPMGIVSASAWREGAKWARSQLAMPVEPQSVAWQPIETAPMDTDVLMAWFYEGQWEFTSGWAGSTKAGYLHSQATHWQPLPTPPVSRPQHSGETK